ncbi:MAG: integration host factor subunit beta [Rickettsiales bacterium]|nr:integration host factor subunit beta [Rickettsiales bacterium]
MTKSDLINEVAEQLPELPRKQVELLVNTVFGSMSDALAGGDRIEVRGFGSFHVRQRAARVGRNPKTGEEVQVAATRVPFFRVGKELRERVNRG